jgi:penicillin-binding protein 1A
VDNLPKVRVEYNKGIIVWTGKVMKKFFLLLILTAFLIFGYKHYQGYLPQSAQETIEKAGDGRLVKENVPGVFLDFWRFTRVSAVIREKMAAPGWVPLRDIPLSMQQAIIAVEDSRFYQHGTFDTSGILRAILVNIQAGEILEGGSTITQQLAKNLFLGGEQTLSRKVSEGVYGVIIESNFSKEEILETYLNTIYFGAGAYGIGQAAEVYFHKKPAALTLAESSLLAGLPAAPSVYSPLDNLPTAKKRQAVVLESMVRNGFIGPNKAKEILAEKLF